MGNLHWLLFEPITEFVVNFADDFAAGLGEVGVGFGGFVDEDERGCTADSHAMEELAFETDLLDEPSGANLVAVVATVDWVAFVFGDFGFG